jgi:asparagine synthase (glutamine-hydrolysing)
MSGKHILKKAVLDLLPREILYRRKLGFPTPWTEWLAGPSLETIENLLLAPRTINRGIIKRESMERIFREHRSGYRDNCDRIWRLLNLELWHRVCVEKDPAPWSQNALSARRVAAAH